MTWTRPSDWIDISTVANNEINLLTGDFASNSIGFAVTVAAAGTYSIDWGDGTVETARASTTIYNHVYTIGSGTPCSLGYTTFKIRIYDATGNITKFAVKHPPVDNYAPIIPLLQAVFGTLELTDLTSAFYLESDCYHIQSVTFPETLNSLTSMITCFKDCYSLQSVTMPTSMTLLSDLSECFYNCYTLQSITLPTELNNLLYISSLFYYCLSLQSVTMPTSMNLLNNLEACFQNCTSLRSVTLPTTLNSATSMMYCFTSCSSLQRMTLPDMPLMDQMDYCFQQCYALQELIFPETMNNLTSLYWVAVSCQALQRVTLPTNMDQLLAMNSSFSGNLSLRSIVLPNYLGNLGSITLCFSNCNALQSITMPTDLSLAVSFNQMFQHCHSLKSIILPATLRVTSIANLFYLCYSLESVTMPTTMDQLSTAASAFRECYSLQSVTLPNLPNISSTGQSMMFYDCRSLTSIVNLDNFGTLTGAQIDGAAFIYNTKITGNLTIGTKFDRFDCYGLYAERQPITSIRLTNAGSNYGGSSPQINVSYNSLGATALNTLFGDLPTLSGKNINISGNPGAATCDKSIAFAKGWDVIANVI